MLGPAKTWTDGGLFTNRLPVYDLAGWGTETRGTETRTRPIALTLDLEGKGRTCDHVIVRLDRDQALRLAAHLIAAFRGAERS